MGLPRVRFPVRRMMLAVALMVLVAGGTVLARRQGAHPDRARSFAHHGQVAARQSPRSEDAPSPATHSPAAESKEDAQFVGDLSPDGRVMSAGSPEAMRIAAAKARGGFDE